MPTWLIKLFHSLGRKQAAKRTGIAQIPTPIEAEGHGAALYTQLREAGFKDADLAKLIKSEKDIIRLVNKVESMQNQKLKSIERKFFDPSGKMKPEGQDIVKKGLEGLGKKKDPFQGFTPKIVPKETVTASPKRIKQGFSTQMKLNRPEENQALIKSFIRRENAEFNALNREQQKEIFDMFDTWAKKDTPDPADFASGGIAGELRLHRQGYAGGKKVDLDRRMILKGMGALAALPVVGKFFKLAKPLAKVRDIRVKMKTDMDWSYEGPESGWEGGTWLNVDFIPLTKKGTKILDDLAKNKKISKSTHGKETYYGVGNSEDGLMAVEDIKKMKGNMELETSVHDKVKGSVKGEYDTTKVYSGKDIDSKKILRESSDLADFPYHDNVFQDEFTEEIISTMGSRVKKVSGGLVDLLSL